MAGKREKGKGKREEGKGKGKTVEDGQTQDGRGRTKTVGGVVRPSPSGVEVVGGAPSGWVGRCWVTVGVKCGVGYLAE